MPAIAPATTGDYEGKVSGDEDATVHFEVRHRHGKDKIRKESGWTRLDANCDGEISPIDTTFYITARVRKSGKFRVDGSDAAKSEIYLEGTIAEDGTASGTLRLRTEIRFGGGDVRDCDSGVEAWSAALG